MFYVFAQTFFIHFCLNDLKSIDKESINLSTLICPQSGPVRAMERLCSLSHGVGISMSVLSFITTIYYSVFTAWSLKLLVSAANVPLGTNSI